MAKDGIARCNEYMFQKVHCRAYMKKINDGRCIVTLQGSETESGRPAYFYADFTKPEKENMREVPPEDWGGGDFVKTYYERTEKEFSGIVIGMKMVALKAELFCDTNFGYDGSERDYVGKNITEQTKVIVVAYGCNRTRLVAMDDFEIMEVVNE